LALIGRIFKRRELNDVGSQPTPRRSAKMEKKKRDMGSSLCEAPKSMRVR
jgi:hypothetical protein